MNNGKLLFLALASGFALALAAPADSAETAGPCAADAAKFCKDVKPGEGRVAACLKDHEKELSQACTERRALKADRRAGKKSGVKKGGVCQRQYGRGFNAGFRSGFKMRGGLGSAKAWKKGVKGGGACAADAKKLCGDVKPGEGRVRACLQKNLDKLSEGCRARQEKGKDKPGTNKKV